MKPTILLLAPLLLLLAGCSKDYNIQLPPHESRLVVECYLEDGQPLRALITESQALLDTNRLPPVILDALVIISHGNRRDTLRPGVYADTLRRRVYNYGSERIVQADFAAGAPWRIDVVDGKGRAVHALTRFLPPVPIGSLTPIFNNEERAYCLTRFFDVPGTRNFYRLVLADNARYDSVELEQLFDENFVNNQGEVIYGSGYDFRRGDTIHATLFHITPEYHRYLSTAENARGALVNPFAASGEVVSNIVGGYGVFAALSFDYRQQVVQ